MGQVTYKDLFSLVKREINKTTSYSRVPRYSDQITLEGTVPMFRETFSDVSSTQLVQSLQELLNEALPDTIIEGLTVEATQPISQSVIIKAGKGSTGGRIYTLDADTTITIPFNDYTRTFFINLYLNRILIDFGPHPEKLTVAKIVVPQPSTTTFVVDTKDDLWNAYIVNQQEYKLYGDANGRFEEETIELLRENMNPLLTDILFGDVVLSENLKITNTAGSLELDSDKLLLMDFDGNTLAKLNQNGVYFYNSAGKELANFATDGARIGNISITPTSLQSTNYVEGATGFKISSDGEVEFNNLDVRGVIHATSGDIGGWTVASNMIYATTTGMIKTSLNAGMGYNGVVLDKDGIRVYDDVLGVVVNLPSDGSAPSFSSGTITSVIWELNTSSIIRTSETVGDGTANSAGILINSTGIYGCEANQVLAEANFKILADGIAVFKGEVQATSGSIGGVTISGNTLVGGTIIGATLRGSVIETSDLLPRIRIDEDGIYYQITKDVGEYAGDTSIYNEFLYGTGVLAYLFNVNYPLLSVLAERDLADLRLYNRSNDPTAGAHELGDFIVTNNRLKRCKTSGSPGTFVDVVSIETRTSNPSDPYDGQTWLRTDINN